MSWILTHSGVQFDLLDPKAEAVHPSDIAHSLARLCRFNGHCENHYSVAEHSLRVAALVPEEHHLVALLHDATEAYVGDMVRPLKQSLPGYQHIEQRIWRIICTRFDIDPVLPACVHEADMVMLATERRDLMPEHPAQWECLDGIAPLKERINLMSVPHAKWAFHQRLMELLGNTHRAKAVGAAQ